MKKEKLNASGKDPMKDHVMYKTRDGGEYLVKQNILY